MHPCNKVAIIASVNIDFGVRSMRGYAILRLIRTPGCKWVVSEVSAHPSPNPMIKNKRVRRISLRRDVKWLQLNFNQALVDLQDSSAVATNGKLQFVFRGAVIVNNTTPSANTSES